MNSTILTLALLCAGMVLLCNVDQATGNNWQTPTLCSTNWYYTNYDCRSNCQVCQYNCNPYDENCGADYDDGQEVGVGANGGNGNVETKSDGGAGGADYG